MTKKLLAIAVAGKLLTLNRPKNSVLKELEVFVKLKERRKATATANMGRKTMTKTGKVVIGMAPELRLDPYKMPADLRKVFESQINRFPEMTPKQEAFFSAIEYVMSNREIEPSSYVMHLKLLLFLEEYARETDMRMYDLKDQKIQYSGTAKEFMVHVPGLSEERPSLQLYDEIELRTEDGSNVCTSTITFIGQKFVKVLSTPKFAKKYSEDHRYNIRFLLPRRTIQCCHLALDLININQLVPAMFPGIKTCYNRLSKDLHWFDENIENNAEQGQAIKNIVARTAHPAPYILFGPPGTGKTSTLVEAISQIWRTSPSSHILICTPSNAAADEIVRRLLKNIPEQDMHRMYGPSRNWDDVDESIQPCSNFVDGEIIFLPKELIMLRRIVVVTLMSCARLLALNLRANHFSYVFIDEAGQATEPETLIPIGLMSSDDSSHKGRLQGQLVIAGDPMQLGPSISAKSVDTLAKSMLERMMEQCAPYKKDNSGKYNPIYITKLIRNFRSHNSILHVPNKLFYDGELIACGKDADINRAANYAALPNKSFPLIFHAVSGDESRESSSPSVCNMSEIAVIMHYLQDLIGAKLGGRKLEQKDIGIVTPYKLQRIKIHQELENRNWGDVSVGTVEVFQGQERDVIIMSTVRSVIYQHNGKEHIGFLSNPKRFNVAVTRAKSLLILVGNPTILKFDNCWKSLIDYCSANKAFIGKNVSRTMTYSQKKALRGKKYVPNQTTATDFQFPVPTAEDTLIAVFENCKPPERLVPNKKARLPKINKDLSPIPQFEFDSGVTSASNSSSTTDSEQQDRVSNASSTDGHSSPDKSTKVSAVSAKASFDKKNVMDYLGGMDSDEYKDALDHSDESTNSSDAEEDAGNSLLELNKMILSRIYQSSYQMI